MQYVIPVWMKDQSRKEKEEGKMKEALKFIHCTHEGQGVSTEDFGMDTALKARAYHRSFPEYSPTP